MGSVTPVALDYISKPFKWLANSKPMDAICKKFEISHDKALAYTTIASIVGKDGIGCYMYVNQSLHNEKIPEEKRSFVAALDLTNGGLMILSQLLMFFTISNKKVQEKMFGKLFNKIFSDKSLAAYTKKLRTKPEFATKTKDEIKKSFEDIRKATEGTFSFLTSLVASTILAKRVVVPFIATPMASWAQTTFMGKKGKKAENENAEQATKSNSVNTVENENQIENIQTTAEKSAESEKIKELPNSNILKHLLQK